MKKLLLGIMFMLMIFSPSVMANDIDLPASGDLWDNWNSVQDSREVKAVSDEEFDKTIDQLKSKNKKFKREEKLKKKQLPKGEEFRNSNETEIITEQSENNNTLPVLSIPVELKAGDVVLPVGHYQIKGEKENGKVFINFYQAQYLMAKFPAVETEDDYDEDTITFGKWLPKGDDKIMVIYGSLDINAYTVIELAQ